MNGAADSPQERRTIVLIDVDALPDALAQALKLQQTPAWLPVEFTAELDNEFGNQASLIGGTQGVYGSLRSIVRTDRRVVRTHDHTIPQFTSPATPSSDLVPPPSSACWRVRWKRR